MNFNFIKPLVVVAALMFILTGCASIVSDNDYPVSFKSNPSDAEIEITNLKGVLVHSGKTPMTVTLDSGAGFFKSAKYKLVFKKEGYKILEETLEAKLDGWYVGNILFGGLIGILVVDPATGAMWKLPKEYSVDFINNGKKITDVSLEVLDFNEVVEEDRQHLVKLN